MDSNTKPNYLPLLQNSSDEDEDVKFKLENKCETNIRINSNLSSSDISSDEFVVPSTKDRIKRKRKRRRRRLSMEPFERSVSSFFYLFLKFLHFSNSSLIGHKMKSSM